MENKIKRVFDITYLSEFIPTRYIASRDRQTRG